MDNIPSVQSRRRAPRKIHLEKWVVLGKKGPVSQWDPQLKAFLQNIDLAVWIGDKDECTLYANPKFCALTGYTLPEIVGRSGYDFDTPETVAKIRQVNTVDRGQGKSSAYEGELLTKTGEHIPVYITGAPLPGGGTLSVIQDLRPLKEKDTDLQIHQAYLSQLFYNAPDAIVALDNDEFILDLNPAFTALFGYTAKEAIGHNIRDLIVPPHSTDESNRLARDIRAGKKVYIESQRQHKDGHLIDVSLTGVNLGLADKQTGFYGIYRDITERKQYETDSASSRKLLFDILQGSPIATYIIDKNHRIVHWNRALERLTGRRAEDMVGTDRHWEIFYPEKRPMIVDHMVDGMKTSAILSRYYKNTDFSLSRFENGAVGDVFFADFPGGGKWLRFMIKPLYDLQGGVIGAIETVQDIHASHLNREALQERMNELHVLYRVHSHTRMAHDLERVLLDIAHDMPFAIARFQSITHAHITFDNKRYCSNKKYCSERKHFRFTHKMEEPIIIRDFQRGKIELGTIKKIPAAGKEPFLPEERKLMASIAQILCRHIESREIFDRHVKLVKRIHTGVFILEGGVFRYANPGFCRIFKTTESQVVDYPCENFFINCPLQNKPVVSSHQFRARRGDGAVIDVQMTTQTLTYHGRQGILGTIRDVTRLKRAEDRLRHFNDELKLKIAEKTRHLERANKRLLSLNELKDEFITVASHELRSPITAIRGYLSFLTEDAVAEALPDTVQQYLTRVNNNVETLNNLINNILDVSRLEGGRFAIKKTTVDLAQVARRIIDNLSVTAGEKKLDIRFENRVPGERCLVQADPVRIHQVFSNILDNAIKYSKRGKKITISLDKLDRMVELQIADQGIGIPKKQIPRIFDKFMQAQNAASRYRGGAGLGLFVAKKIVELHRGTIEVDSVQGQGTTFVVRLPAR